MDTIDFLKLRILQSEDDGYTYTSLSELYDDYSKLCYRKRMNEIEISDNYRPTNIEVIDIDSMTYEELEQENFHWCLDKYLKRIDHFGIPSCIGENSRGIDKKPGIFFSRGIEGVLELWNTWLKWRLYRLENPMYEGINYDDISANLKRYNHGLITELEAYRLKAFNYLFLSKSFLDDDHMLNKLFEFEYLEMSNSSYMTINLDGLCFNPDEVIDQNKVNYIRGGKRNKFLEVQYDHYSNLDSIYSDKWNYKIDNDLRGPWGDNLVIEPSRISLLVTGDKSDLNSILLKFYSMYHDSVPFNERVHFDLLDKYILFVREKRKTEKGKLNRKKL